jgi:CCR4-NOT transcription complex subunit 1
VTGFWQTWNNPLYQLRLLDALLSLPSDTFNFVTLPGRRVVTIDDIPASSPTIKLLAANVQGHTWNSLDLFEVLVRLADADSEDVRNYIREMLDKAVKLSAEIVHMGLLQVSVSIARLLCFEMLLTSWFRTFPGMKSVESTRSVF